MKNKAIKPLILGVTGGIACGKSEVGQILEKMGFSVCDTDGVAHDLMKKGNPIYQQIVDYFGVRILLEDGEISRPILGQLVFENPKERGVLNSIVHPVVREFIELSTVQMQQQEQNAAVLVPLLFESGMVDLMWDAILCVSSSEDQILKRLKNRGLTQTEAELRIASQMSVAEKERLSDYVIPNVGTRIELEEFTRKIVGRIRVEREL